MGATDLPTVQPLEGKTTIDDKMVFEPERLSYVSAAKVAAEIAGKLPDPKELGPLIVIARVSLLADMANLQATGTLLDGLQQDYESLGGQAKDLLQSRGSGLQMEAAPDTAEKPEITNLPAPIPALPLVAAGLNAALGLVSLFREDVSFSGVKTGVDALAFELALASALKKRGFARVLIPDLCVIPAGGATEDSLQSKLQKIEDAKLGLWQAVSPLVSELVELDTELDQASRGGDQPTVDSLTGEIAQLRRDLSPITEPLSRVDQRYSEILSQLQKADADSGLTGLARLLRAEAISGMEPEFLHAQVVSSGGHNRIQRSLWRTLFGGDGLSFMGGVVVRWARLSSTGEIQQGGILTCRQTADFAAGS
jgi:hypothetical protein